MGLKKVYKYLKNFLLINIFYVSYANKITNKNFFFI